MLYSPALAAAYDAGGVLDCNQSSQVLVNPSSLLQSFSTSSPSNPYTPSTSARLTKGTKTLTNMLPKYTLAFFPFSSAPSFEGFPCEAAAMVEEKEVEIVRGVVVKTSMKVVPDSSRDPSRSARRSR